jgi:hypothetical protein
VASFKLRPLYPQRKIFWYPLDKRLAGLRICQNAGEKQQISPPPEIEPRPSSPKPVSATTEPFRFFALKNLALKVFLR